MESTRYTNPTALYDTLLYPVTDDNKPYAGENACQIQTQEPAELEMYCCCMGKLPNDCG